MKFTISKESFLDAINQVQHVVSSRTTLAILSNVLLKAKDGRLELTTTDLDVGVTCSVPCEVDEPGATTLPARRLATIVRELPAEEIEVKVDEKNVASIRSGPSYFKVLGLTSEEFPALPRFDDAREFRIEQQVLRDCLRKTSYAISTDETRYVLNGILFAFKDNALTMVATDGRRLAMVEQELEFPQSQEIDIIVPTKAVNELSRLLGDSGEVAIHVFPCWSPKNRTQSNSSSRRAAWKSWRLLRMSGKRVKRWPSITRASQSPSHLIQSLRWHRCAI
jgi:DNA polymerase-3 subunit beta